MNINISHNSCAGVCGSRQVVPGTCTLFLGMLTTQLPMKLCCIVIYIVCMTSEVTVDDSVNGGMNFFYLFKLYTLKCN